MVHHKDLYDQNFNAEEMNFWVWEGTIEHEWNECVIVSNFLC